MPEVSNLAYNKINIYLVTAISSSPKHGLLTIARIVWWLPMDFRVHAENSYVHGLRSTTKLTSLQTPDCVVTTATCTMNRRQHTVNWTKISIIAMDHCTLTEGKSNRERLVIVTEKQMRQFLLNPPPPPNFPLPSYTHASYIHIHATFWHIMYFRHISRWPVGYQLRQLMIQM